MIVIGASLDGSIRKPSSTLTLTLSCGIIHAHCDRARQLEGSYNNEVVGIRTVVRRIDRRSSRR